MARGGKTYEDRIKSSKVRDKVLDAILNVYSGKAHKLSQRQWELTLRMATTVLPRLNELTGPDGEELKVFVPYPVATAFNIHASPNKKTGGGNPV